MQFIMTVCNTCLRTEQLKHDANIDSDTVSALSISKNMFKKQTKEYVKLNNCMLNENLHAIFRYKIDGHRIGVS